MVSWTSLRPEESMSMQRLTMASNSKCFHVKIFVHYLQRFSLLISDSLELLTVDQYTPVSGQSLQGFIKVVFLILQRFQNYRAAISWPANPIIMFSWHRHQSADCKVIITIPSHSQSQPQERRQSSGLSQYPAQETF